MNKPKLNKKINDDGIIYYISKYQPNNKITVYNFNSSNNVEQLKYDYSSEEETLNRKNRDPSKLFPYLSNKSQLCNLKIDDKSLNYISGREDSARITVVLKIELEYMSKDKGILGNLIRDCVITDATSGVGGNTISFAGEFKHVHSIEIESQRYEYLLNNVDIYELDNVICYNDNCLNVIYNICDHDVIFFDPPWGGRGYKNVKNIRLQLSNIEIENICNDLMDDKKMLKVPKLLSLKLPLNYDIEYLKKMINYKVKIVVMKRMQIILIHAVNKKIGE